MKPDYMDILMCRPTVGGYNAKSVIIDIADTYTNSSFMQLRSIDFYNVGVLIPMNDSLGTFYTNSEFNPVTHGVKLAFDTSTSKVGQPTDEAWVSKNGVTNNIRGIGVFDTSIIFDEIVINNGHNGGAITNRGAQNVKIHISTDAITDTTYNAAIANSILIFDNVFTEHIASDIVDNQLLVLL